MHESGVVRVDPRVHGDEGEGIGGPVHPLIRRHPQTGDESVWLSCANVAFMDAPALPTQPAVHLDCSASYALVDQLVGRSTHLGPPT